MSETRIYLAGPVMSMADGGAGWREDLTERFGDAYDLKNPLSKYNVPVDELEVVDGASHGGDAAVSVSEIVETDKHLLAQSDAVLVGYSAVRSIGTPMEVMWAHEREMPVALWLRDSTDYDELSPWYRYHADVVTDDVLVALGAFAGLGGESDE